MGNTFYFDWEVQLMQFLQENMGQFGVALASFFTYFGEDLAILAVILIVYLGIDKEKGRIIGLTVITAVTLNPMIKNVFNRRRPYFDHAEISCLRPVASGADVMDVAAQGFSFPSAHSMCSAALYGTLAMQFKKRWLTIVCIVLPLLVGLSRVCLGVHYPTDVLVGWICGVLLMLLLPVLYRKVKRKWLLYLIMFILGCSGFFYCNTADYYTGIGIMGGFFLADLFECRFVKFEDNHHPVAIILRLVSSIGGYLLLDFLLKLPFSYEFLHDGSMASFLVRFGRYFLVVFVLLAFLPMLYKPIEHKFGFVKAPKTKKSENK